MEETERSLHDAIMIVRRAIKNDAVVAGMIAIVIYLKVVCLSTLELPQVEEQSKWNSLNIYEMSRVRLLERNRC